VNIRSVYKRVDSGGSKGITFLSQHPATGRWWQIECEFPPNDSHWLAEIEKVLASPKPSVIWSVKVEVTREILTTTNADHFEGKLMDLEMIYRTPALPPTTYG
jgi:hypothetical protein